MRTTLAVMTFWFFVAGCASIGNQRNVSASQVQFVTVDKGSSSGFRERKFIVIKTEGEWKDLWREHQSRANPPKNLPPVDYSKEMIVTAFLGEKMSGGYSVEITGIEENAEKNQLNIFWRESKPPPGSMTIQALTQPYHIVKLKKADPPVVFVPVQ